MDIIKDNYRRTKERRPLVCGGKVIGDRNRGRLTRWDEVWVKSRFSRLILFHCHNSHRGIYLSLEFGDLLRNICPWKTPFIFSWIQDLPEASTTSILLAFFHGHCIDNSAQYQYYTDAQIHRPAEYRGSPDDSV